MTTTPNHSSPRLLVPAISLMVPLGWALAGCVVEDGDEETTSSTTGSTGPTSSGTGGATSGESDVGSSSTTTDSDSASTGASSDSSSSTSGSSGGAPDTDSSTGTGGACLSCDAALDQGFITSDVCDDDDWEMFVEVMQCACAFGPSGAGQGLCDTECEGNLCDKPPAPIEADCRTCIDAMCSAEVTACEAT